MSEVTQTAEVLAAMWTENTGRHMLDSGGAYGRNWERNQGNGAADFLARPAAYWDNGPTLDLFHFCADRLEYAPIMDRALRIFAESTEEHSTEPWMATMESFAECTHDESVTCERVRGARNSYNDETFLNGTIQFVEFDYADVHYVALQYHGGCDVRGGYTSARVFTTSPDWYYGCCDATVYCPNEECRALAETVDMNLPMIGDARPVMLATSPTWDFRGPSDVTDTDGTSTDELDRACYDRAHWEDKSLPNMEGLCPRCMTPLAVDAPYYDSYY